MPPGADLRDVLIYDGDCGFCQRSLVILQRMVRRPLKAVPSVLAAESLSPSDRARTAHEILYVDSAGHVFGAAAAIAAALRAAGRPGLAWLVDHTPGAESLYRFVAARRHSVSCSVSPRRSPEPPSSPQSPGPSRN